MSHLEEVHAEGVHAATRDPRGASVEERLVLEALLPEVPNICLEELRVVDDDANGDGQSDGRRQPRVPLIPAHKMFTFIPPPQRALLNLFLEVRRCQARVGDFIDLRQEEESHRLQDQAAQTIAEIQELGSYAKDDDIDDDLGKLAKQDGRHSIASGQVRDHQRSTILLQIAAGTVRVGSRQTEHRTHSPKVVHNSGKHLDCPHEDQHRLREPDGVVLKTEVERPLFDNIIDGQLPRRVRRDSGPQCREFRAQVDLPRIFPFFDWVGIHQEGQAKHQTQGDRVQEERKQQVEHEVNVGLLHKGFPVCKLGDCIEERAAGGAFQTVLPIEVQLSLTSFVLIFKLMVSVLARRRSFQHTGTSTHTHRGMVSRKPMRTPWLPTSTGA
mmetsp:Transcript_66860/g.217432  ORF Transcript_66860/g.217432 Transcript_66860/m.217432 type:complete len:384 (+) Transcript_66860:390-1541(+)